MEPESSLPPLQEHTTCPILSRDQSSSCPRIQLPEDPSQYYPPIHSRVFQFVSFPQVFPPKPCMHLSPIRATYPAHLILLDLITRVIFGEQHPILKHPQPTFLYQFGRPSFTPIQHNRQNYSSVCLINFILEAGK